MFEELRDAFGEMLNETEWMDASTKKTALFKLKAMLPLVGYPDFVLNETLLDEFYEEVRFFQDISTLGAGDQWNYELRRDGELPLDVEDSTRISQTRTTCRPAGILYSFH